MTSLVLDMVAAPYGHLCCACRETGDTLHVRLYLGKECLREAHVCSGCLGVGAEVEFALPEEVMKSQAVLRESQRLEQGLANDMGGRPQAGSGNSTLPGLRGDVRVEGKWRLQHKFSDGLKGTRLKLSDMADTIRVAAPNEMPVMIIEFRRLRESLAVLPYNTFLEIKEALNADEDS